MDLEQRIVNGLRRSLGRPVRISVLGLALVAALPGLGAAPSQAQAAAPSLLDRAADLLANPIAAVILITLGVLGVLFEIQTAGWGVGGTLAIVSLGLFFFSHFVAGMAGWSGVLLVVLGVALIFAEVFVLPGFGFTGALGILAFLGGIYISMVGDFSSASQLLEAGYILAVSLVLIIAGSWVSLTYLPRTRSLKGMVLLESVAALGKPFTNRDSRPDLRSNVAGAREAHERETVPSLEGAIGVAVSSLRPAGIAEIDGRSVDVVTEGQYIEAGTKVEVVKDEAYRRVVRPLKERES